VIEATARFKRPAGHTAARWGSPSPMTIVLSGQLCLPSMTRMRDIDPAIIRAEYAADPFKMAREIVSAKIQAGLKFTVKDPDARRCAAEEWHTKTRCSPNCL
jgi:hypothetical protein